MMVVVVMSSIDTVTYVGVFTRVESWLEYTAHCKETKKKNNKNLRIVHMRARSRSTITTCIKRVLANYITRRRRR